MSEHNCRGQWRCDSTEHMYDINVLAWLNCWLNSFLGTFATVTHSKPSGWVAWIKALCEEFLSLRRHKMFL